MIEGIDSMFIQNVDRIGYNPQHNELSEIIPDEVKCTLVPTRVRESKPRCRTTRFTLFSMWRTSELIFILWSPSRTVKRATSHELMLQHNYLCVCDSVSHSSLTFGWEIVVSPPLPGFFKTIEIEKEETKY
jgi:hypothetical protein